MAQIEDLTTIEGQEILEVTLTKYGRVCIRCKDGRHIIIRPNIAATTNNVLYLYLAIEEE